MVGIKIFSKLYFSLITDDSGGDIDDGSASSTYLLLYLGNLPHFNCRCIFDIRIIIGTDYGAGPYSVTFPAGSTRALLNISIIDDDIAESIENFTLFIDPSSLPSNVTMGDYNQTTITILDNDCKFYINVSIVRIAIDMYSMPVHKMLQ